MTKKLFTLTLMLILLASLSWAVSEEPSASMNVNEFKDLLDQNRILTAEKARWSSVEGLFIDNHGLTNRYKIDYISEPSPFFVDALKAKGIEMGFKISAPDSGSCGTSWTDPTFLTFFITILIILIMQILTFVRVLRIMKRVNK